MYLVTYGINHTTTPVNIRERFVFDITQLPQALSAVYAIDTVKEVVIVSTCNRTEIYCCVEDNSDQAILSWLHQFHQQADDMLSPYLYQYRDDDAIRHLLRVACSLDSMVVGEPQILGQLKEAYSYAVNARTVNKSLGRLFQHAFTAAKQVRTHTAIGNSPVSVAFAAVNLAKQIFSELAESTALLIGAGETIELAARHLFDNGIKRLIIANRSVERAHSIAAQFNGYAISLSELPNHLAEADIIISSTASQLPILGKGAVEKAIKQRKRKPIFMVDIAVPRDIEEEVGLMEDIYLYSVDDLKDIIEETLQSRREAATQAEEMVNTQVEHFLAWLRNQDDAVPVIRAIRDNADRISNQAIDKALKQIALGQAADQVITELARNLTNRLLHEPSRQLRQSGFDDNDQLVKFARRLFNIEEK